MNPVNDEDAGIVLFSMFLSQSLAVHSISLIHAYADHYVLSFSFDPLDLEGKADRNTSRGNPTDSTERDIL